MSIFEAENLRLAFCIVLAVLVVFNGLILARFLIKRKSFFFDYHVFLRKILSYYKVVNIIGFFLILFSIISLLHISPEVVYPKDPALGVSEVSDKNPVVLELSTYFDSNSVQAEIHPELPGSWRAERSLLFGKNRYIFSPEKSPVLGERYTISFSKIRNILNDDESEYLFSFQAPSVPKIESISVSDGDQGVLENQSIKVEYSDYPRDSVEFSYRFSPEVGFDIEKQEKGDVITPREGFQRGTEYVLKVERQLFVTDYLSGEKEPQGAKEEVKSISFKTIDAPGVAATSPTGSGVLVDANIAITFKQDMDKESVEKSFTLSPEVPGSFSWDGERKMLFNPTSNLSKNTKYTVSLSRDIQTLTGEAFEEDVSFSFTTIGHVVVSSFSPTGGAGGVELSTPVAVTFNQAVDHSSAESAFSITPNISGSFSWSGNKMVYSHDGFSYGTKYEVQIASGVKSINGLDSKKSFSSSFTTKTESRMLSVPSYKQQHMYSCMIAAARSALAYKGVYVSEADIISRVGFDNTSWSGTWSEDGAVWGDPNDAIVGDLDGKADNLGWGYGSHWGPIAEAIRSYGVTAEVKSGFSASGIASEIAAGNPVIVWWVNGVWPAYEVYWNTPQGERIRAVNSMHVQVAKGFTGSADNPQTITVTDSGYGYPATTFDIGTFNAKWGWFGKTGIVIK